MPATTGTNAAAGLAACWDVFNVESDPMRAFWNLHIQAHERRFFLSAASLPTHLEGRAWDELKSEEKKAIKATAARFKRWLKDLEGRGL